MGKNKQQTAPAASTIVDENNLPEVLQGQATKPETFEVIKQKLDEETEKEKQNLLLRRYKKALYRNGTALLQRRRDRELGDEVSLYKVRQMTRMIRFLLGAKVDEKTLEYAKTPDEIWNKEKLSSDGKSIEVTLPDGTKKTFKEGDTIPPIIDVVDFDDMYEQLEKKLREKQEAVMQRYNKDVQKWDLQFGEYYDRSWRW